MKKDKPVPKVSKVSQVGQKRARSAQKSLEPDRFSFINISETSEEETNAVLNDSISSSIGPRKKYARRSSPPLKPRQEG